MSSSPEQREHAVLERVLDEARELTGATYAALGILDDDRRELERFLTVGIDARERAHRLVQEALTNVAKHAEATNVEISVVEQATQHDAQAHSVSLTRRPLVRAAARA